ncbi:serine/arginine repetitive matrix protein 1-like [Poecile atricapillus]|uniref:serine/arginine repetitive matrix protein 1-like n=1 Tax=Poecile atricapillus TaxID=48891 RepID=UPI002739F201|nr:serine/arginine repetitive matrix protein 1-like [Poecile atricapillus]
MTGRRCGQQHRAAADGNRRRAARQPRQRSLDGPLSPARAELPAPSRRGREPPQRRRQPRPPARPRHRLTPHGRTGNTLRGTACPETPPPAPPPPSVPPAQKHRPQHRLPPRYRLSSTARPGGGGWGGRHGRVAPRRTGHGGAMLWGLGGKLVPVWEGSRAPPGWTISPKLHRQPGSGIVRAREC